MNTKDQKPEQINLLEKYKKKKLWFFLVIVIWMIINIIGSYWPEIDQYLFFKIDKFGNFSDWIMILVTSITGYFIYKTLITQNHTLESQKNVQQMQLIQTRAMLVQAAITNIPKFKLQSLNEVMEPRTYKLITGHKTILMLQITNESTQNITNLIVKNKNEFEKLSILFPESIPMGWFHNFICTFNKEAVNNVIEKSIEFEFKDSLGCEYSMKFNIVIQINFDGDEGIPDVDIKVIHRPKLNRYPFE